MRVYTVRKPGPNTDKEFQEYTGLLEEIGIDLTNVPRTLEPGTTNRWLYVWKSKPQAERFARELGARLRDSSWFVHEFELGREEFGPLAPLTILSIPVNKGTVLRLEANSQARIMRHYPNARLQGEVMVPRDVRKYIKGQNGLAWYQAKVINPLTGITQQAIDHLGGIRLVTLNGEVLIPHERLSSAISQ